MTVPLRNTNTRYNRLQREEVEEENLSVGRNNDNNNNNNNSNNSSTLSIEEGSTTDRLLSSNNSSIAISSNNNNNNDENEKNEDIITIYILDTVQKKFQLSVNKTMTILEFKDYSSAIHHVPTASQRLIHMGRLLSDDERLCDSKICNDSIIHLFPKPNIVIQSSSSHAEGDGENSNSVGVGGGGGEEDAEIEHRAHIPQIVLDIEEARRSSSMSVLLTSSEMFEAQHRVKLLAFLLLIICSMELLTLVTIMLGVPQQDENDVPPGDPTDIPFASSSAQNNAQVEMRSWRNSDYVDLAISAFGFYVATLGIKATTDNTLRTAKRYYVGLIMTGIAWIAYYYYINVDDARQRQQQSQSSHTTNIDDSTTNSTTTDNNNFSNDPYHGYTDTNDNTESNIYMEGFYGIMFPVFIWTMCFIRAWQFKTLIAEAELEMNNRFDELLGQQQQQEAQQNSNSSNQQINSSSATTSIGDDLSLQIDDIDTHNIV